VIDVWQDTDRLIPGRRWKNEIRNAIKSGDFFIACFSDNYAARSRTYMREELLLAIEELRLRPADRTWFIPVMLTPTEIPTISVGAGETLRDFQWVNLYDGWEEGISSLVRGFS
jgi:TIR domain